jgi:hypothetical protein
MSDLGMWKNAGGVWKKPVDKGSLQNLVHALWKYADGKGDMAIGPSESGDSWFNENFKRAVPRMKKLQAVLDAREGYHVKLKSLTFGLVQSGNNPYRAQRLAREGLKKMLPRQFQAGKQGISEFIDGP